MRGSWFPPTWRGRRRIAHPVAWARVPEFDLGIAFVQTRAKHGHENKWYLYIRRFNEADIWAVPVMAQTVHTTPIGSTQTATSPADWNNASNSVEVIGTGARGAIGASTSSSGGGAGGGAYSKIVNATITTPGTTPYYWRIGATTATNGSVGGDSWWTLTSPGTSFPAAGTAVGAKGGAALVSTTTTTGGIGGALAAAYASPATGSVKTAGGNGGTGGATATSGGGGGGAGGAAGNGVNGSTGPGAGGAGNVSTANLGGGGGPAGNGAPALGGAGTNLSTAPAAGSGGGGGGANTSGGTGGQGGLYGGGGGGGARSSGVGGQGRQGVVVLTWIPEVTGTLVEVETIDTASITGTAVATGAMAAADGDRYELLLHLDGADTSTAFPDSGGQNQTVTAHGAAQIDTGQAVFGGQALQLASAADYLSLDSGDYAFGTGDFCIDMRARVSSASDVQYFYDGGPGGFQILYDGTALKFTSAAGTIIGSALAADTNYHIAATCAAGSTRLFLDGVQQGSTLPDATNYSVAAGYPRIGGGALYEAGCLFHFDGANLSTTLVNSSGNGHVMTPVGDVLYISNTVGRWKFGGSSLQIGGSGDWYELDGSADLAFGTGDFTIDFWVTLSSTSGTRHLYDSRPTAATNGPYPVISNLSGTGLRYMVGTTVAIIGTGLIFNTMYHIAVTRAAGTTRLFIDGVVQGTYADSNNYIVGANRPTCSSNGGWMDELHVVKGRAEWTADFTPPTAPWVGPKEAADAATAWAAAVVTAGGTVSAGRKTLVTDLVGGLMTDGVWHALDRLHVFPAENEPSALVDLKNQVLATKTNVPWFVADQGYYVFARGGYFIDLNFNTTTSAVNYSRNLAHLSFWSMGNYSGLNDQTVLTIGDGQTQLIPRYSTNNCYGRVNEISSGPYIANSDMRGFYLINRSGANAQQMYRDGVSIGSNTQASLAVVSQGTQYYFGSGVVISIGGSLGPAEALKFHNRLLTYMRAVFGVTNVETMAWIKETYRQGGTVSAGRKALVDALISSLKTDGVFYKLDYCWLYAAENAKSALIDIRGGVTASPIGGPVFTADRGYLTSASAYINTNVVPISVDNYKIDTGLLAEWIETATTSNSAILCGNLGSKNSYLWSNASGNYGVAINDNSGSALDSTTPKTGTGLLTGSRTASNALALYLNGVSIVSGSNASADPFAFANFVGGRNNNGAIDAPAPHRSAALIVGAGLNATEQLALFNHVRTYMTAVGVA